MRCGRASDNRNVSDYGSPPCALGHAHIFEAPSGDHSMELLETIFERDRAWRLGGGIPIPATELCDDPGGPAKACFWVGIFLERCPAFELGVEAVEQGDFICRERYGGWLGGGSVTRLKHLQGDDGGLGRDGGELDQPIGGLDLTVFESQALLL